MSKLKLFIRLFSVVVLLQSSIIIGQIELYNNQAKLDSIRNEISIRKNKQKSISLISTEETIFTSINQVKLAVSNTTTGAPLLREGGGFWPGGREAFKNIVFYDGLQLVGKIDNELTCIGVHPVYFYGENNVQPGKIFDDGTVANPNDPQYQIYRIQRGWESTPFGKLRDELERDYNLWPISDGAPWTDIDGDGLFSRSIDQPAYLGDEVLFYVSNDASASLKHFDEGINKILKPMNVEIQVTVFSQQGNNSLGDVVFRKYKIINKGTDTIEDLYLSFSSDTEAGGYIDDLGACDITLDLGYVYNGLNSDDLFDDKPPAVGHVLVQGPRVPALPTDSAYFDGKWIKGYKNLGMTSFNYFSAEGNPNPDLIPDSVFYKYKYTEPSNVKLLYNTVQGKLAYGQPQLDPLGNPTPFALSGDPVAGTGWYDDPSAWPGYDSLSLGPHDIRYQLSTGPVTLAPFDTNEVVIALVAAVGEDRLNSITELKKKANAVKIAYFTNFETIPPVPKPIVNAFEKNESVTIWWKDNVESYDEFDIFLEGQNEIDTTFTFEGYIIEQFEDSLGSNPQTITVVDRINLVTVIESFVIANGVSVKLPVIHGSDSGLQRFVNITEDLFTGGPLLSGTPYYFGVTAYAYSKESDPTFNKSEPSIIKIVPGKPKIDYSSKYKQFEEVPSNQIVGQSDVFVGSRIIDPSYLTGNAYEVGFEEDSLGFLYYSFVETATGDSLIKRNFDFSVDSLTQRIIDGFLPIVINYGQDSINTIDKNNTYAVNKILEIKNGEGFLDSPQNVLNQLNSTSEWKFKIGGAVIPTKTQLNYSDHLGYYIYEIRFTLEGSEYYTTGYSPLFFERNDDPKGKGRVPFEVWQISRDGSEEKRLVIKVYDKSLQDTTWTKDESTNLWERFFTYEPEGEYPESFPEKSGRSLGAQHRIGNIVFEGEQPAEGTVIRITTFRPLIKGDRFEIKLDPPNFNDTETAKENIDEISAFPNPFFAGNNATDQNYIRFIGLPTKTVIRIFSISGQLVRRLDKDDLKKFIDWDLKNNNGNTVAGGMYIAHLDMPEISTKILKLAIIPSKQFLDRQ